MTRDTDTLDNLLSCLIIRLEQWEETGMGIHLRAAAHYINQLDLPDSLKGNLACKIAGTSPFTEDVLQLQRHWHLQHAGDLVEQAWQYRNFTGNSRSKANPRHLSVFALLILVKYWQAECRLLGV